MAAMPSETVRLIQQVAICRALQRGRIRLGTVTNVTFETRRKGSVIVVGLDELDDLVGP